MNTPAVPLSSASTLASNLARTHSTGHGGWQSSTHEMVHSGGSPSGNAPTSPSGVSNGSCPSNGTAV
eukprot:30936-Pelagococcus_subviridis.AAC.22